MVVATRLMKMGFSVFSAFNKADRVDLIILHKRKCPIKIQVKTTTSINNTAFLLLRKMCLNPKYRSNYSIEEIDVFALYVDDLDDVLFIRAEEALKNRNRMSFRYSVARNSQVIGTRMASDYRIFPVDA